MSNIHTLYGAAASLYTGKARAYLIKNRIPYREVAPAGEHYRTRILPSAGARTIPILETVAGEVIRDSTAIIEHFESASGHGALPTGPKQRIVVLLFDVLGSEGLLRPAMHYRWNFDAQNLDFLNVHFQVGMPPGPDRAARATGFMNRMRQAAVAFGVTPQTHELVETLYVELLTVLDAHFECSPYLLGGRPSIGDFGLIAPLYAHLGRDPAPLALMQSRAPHLFRWVERMNRPEPDVGEFPESSPKFFADDEVPTTLRAVLAHLALDFIPETTAAAACINTWIAAQPNLASTTPIERGVGLAPFQVRGHTLQGLAQPYRFYLLQRMQTQFERLPPADRAHVEQLLADCGMAEALTIRIDRRIGREANQEVWAN